MSAKSQDTPFTLVINGQEQSVTSRDHLRELLASVRKLDFAEVWLDKANGGAQCLLKNQDRAWLMFLRHKDGDAGFSSHNPDYTGPQDAMVEFQLSNGQGDEYPAAWCLPLETALRAVEHFFIYGEKAPWVHWHEDG
jgi:hypothetical protein